MAKEKVLTFTCDDLPKRSFDFFRDMKRKEELCDVIFQVGNESVSAHRIIIMAVIPNLRDTLVSKNVDARGGGIGISMADIEPSAFKCLIEFAYSCELKIDTENVRNLLAAACYLGVYRVKEACCDFLADTLEEENVMSIWELAQELNCTELLENVDCYLKENFGEMSQTQHFLNWSSAYMKELIGKDDLNVDNEEQVLESVLKWVKHSPKERITYLPELLRKVRMPLVEPLYLTKIIGREQILRTSLLCRDLFDEAKNYNLFPEIRKSTCSFPTEPRLSNKTYTVQDNDSKDIFKLHYMQRYTVQHYSVMEQTWKTGVSRIFYENFGFAAEFQEKIYYFCWGYTVKYDAAKNVFEFLSDMPTPRVCAGASCLKNKIYVCGGRVGKTAFNVVECFEPEKNEWTSTQSMRTSRWGLNVVALGGYVFALGGRDTSCIHGSVERYNTTTNKWRTMSSMLTKRCFAGAATVNGKIYISGGRIIPSGTKVTATAEVYDPIKNKWEYISTMSTTRHGLTILSSHGKLYAIGGKNDVGKFVYYFEIYDPESDEWTHGVPTDNNHLTSAAVAISTANI